MKKIVDICNPGLYQSFLLLYFFHKFNLSKSCQHPGLVDWIVSLEFWKKGKKKMYFAFLNLLSYIILEYLQRFI